ncbi:MAG: cupin domain-containing protein [Desulfobacterales bacterium]|nr:cupin domain-containing protein [Desulfobacterales bacterium]
MTNKKIIRLEPNGPEGVGLEELELNPADFQSSLPVQHAYDYYVDEDSGLIIGVWDTTTMQEKFGPYEMDEFMWVIEGHVTMVDENDDETIVKAGEAFIIPKGYPCSWRQDGYLKKYAMIFDPPEGEIPETPTVNGIIKPLSDGPMMELAATDTFIIKGEMPTQKHHIYYEDITGQMRSGTWGSTPFESEMKPFPRNEMVCLLEGNITLMDVDRCEHHFKAGEAFFIPMGTICSWWVMEHVRTFYAIFQPAGGAF